MSIPNMVKKKSVDGPDADPRRGRGRPRAFDVAATTEAALMLFWQQGFEATTFEEVTEQTGVNASSLFTAYGNKHGLFMAALERYRAELGERLSVLEHGESGLDDLVAFIGWLTDLNTSGKRPLGCLMVNTMVEFGNAEPSVVEQVARYRQQLTMSIQATLVRASKLGEISSTTVTARTQLVYVGLIGALVIANLGSSKEVVDALDAVCLEIKSWKSKVAGRAKRI